MKRLLVLALALLAPSLAHAQAARIVSACGATAPFGAQGAGGQVVLSVDPNGVLCTNASGGGGGGATTAIAGAYVDGWSATHGFKVDAAWDLIAGSPSLVAIEKKIALQMAGAIPQQSTDGVIIGGVQPAASTLGGATQFHVVALATNNSQLVGAAGAHTVYSVQLGGIGSAPAYLKFYDKASAPTCQTDAIKTTLIIPAAATPANGGGSNVSVPVGKAFALGIGICVTQLMPDNDNTSVAAATYIVNIDYK